MSSFRWGMIACLTTRDSQVTGWELRHLQFSHHSRHVFETGRNNSTRVMWKQELLQPLWLSLDCLLELGKLSYLIWKRTSKATCWYQNLDHRPTDRYFMIIFWRPPGVYKSSSTFWPLTLQPLEVYWATVQQMKGHIHGFHMRYISIPSPKRLQR